MTTLFGLIQVTKAKLLTPVKMYPGIQFQTNIPTKTIKKYLYLEIRQPVTMTPSSSRNKVWKRVALTRVVGQIMAAGQTRNRRMTPAKEYPMH